MARWQRLRANPDGTYRAFYQTGFFSAHAGRFTTAQNVTNLCLVLGEKQTSEENNSWNLHVQHVAY